jgi:hypothetical protein
LSSSGPVLSTRCPPTAASSDAATTTPKPLTLTRSDPATPSSRCPLIPLHRRLGAPHSEIDLNEAMHYTRFEIEIESYVLICLKLKLI